LARALDSIETGDQFREESLARSAEPSGTCGFGNCALYFCHAMLQIARYAEQKRVTESGIIHSCQLPQSVPISKFKSSAAENTRTKVQAESDLALRVARICVPR